MIWQKDEIDDKIIPTIISYFFQKLTSKMGKYFESVEWIYSILTNRLSKNASNKSKKPFNKAQMSN